VIRQPAALSRAEEIGSRKAYPKARAPEASLTREGPIGFIDSAGSLARSIAANRDTPHSCGAAPASNRLSQRESKMTLAARENQSIAPRLNQPGLRERSRASFDILRGRRYEVVFRK